MSAADLPLGEPDPDWDEKFWEQRFDDLHKLVLDWCFQPSAKASAALRTWIEGNHSYIASPEMQEAAARRRKAQESWT